MGKIQCTLIALGIVSFAEALYASPQEDFYERAAGAPFDRVKACKESYDASQDPQVDTQDANNGCLYYCSFRNGWSTLTGTRARRQKRQPDFTACGIDGQCIHGKCFHVSCIEKCQRVIGSSRRLTNIFKSGSLDLTRIYCRGDHSPINNYYFQVNNSYECEMANQTAPAPKPMPDPTPSTVYQDPLTTCQQKYGGSSPSITARIWANGCYFRCFRNGKKTTKKFVQPNGMTCGNNYKCLQGKCESVSCINKCTNSSNGKILKKIKQSSSTVTCVYRGLGGNVKFPMTAGQMCEATYPSDEAKGGPGRQVNTTGGGGSGTGGSGSGTGSGGSGTGGDGSGTGGGGSGTGGDGSGTGGGGSGTGGDGSGTGGGGSGTGGNGSGTGGSGSGTGGGGSGSGTVPVNPTQECKRIHANETSKPITAKNFHNKCFFRCYKGDVQVLRKHVQPNKMSCGTNYECLNGECYSSKCIKTCRDHMSNLPLRKLTQSGSAKTDLKCYTNGKVSSQVQLVVTAADDCVHNTNNGVPDV